MHLAMHATEAGLVGVWTDEVEAVAEPSMSPVQAQKIQTAQAHNITTTLQSALILLMHNHWILPNGSLSRLLWDIFILCTQCSTMSSAKEAGLAVVPSSRQSMRWLVMPVPELYRMLTGPL